MKSLEATAIFLALIAVAGWGCPGPSERPDPVASATEAGNQEILNRGQDKDRWWHQLPRAAWAEYRQIEHGQGWFEVYEIRPGVLAIYEPGQFEEVISYLILGSERALLLDTGLGIGDIAALVAELTDKEVAVINSHTHYDHVGGNHSFDTIYGTNLDYTRANARGRIHSEVAEFVGPGWIWKETPSGFSAGAYVSRPFAVSHTVEDGQVISLGDRTLEVLLTPGHAPDALCLLDREQGLLFTGDTLYPATLYAHLPGASFDQYAATANRLAQLAGSVETLLPAHNEPAMAPNELVRLASAFDAIRAGGMDFVLTDGNREYDFGRFSIMVPDQHRGSSAASRGGGPLEAEVVVEPEALAVLRAGDRLDQKQPRHQLPAITESVRGSQLMASVVAAVGLDR
jgi:glyoxylase-like metal-dependent hydrolase (beta-lactamase superfamily II)